MPRSFLASSKADMIGEAHLLVGQTFVKLSVL